VVEFADIPGICNEVEKGDLVTFDAFLFNE
jgi:hypothetical protein